MAKQEDYILFIDKQLRAGIVERNKVLAKFVKKWQVSDRTFDRAWKIAQEKHTQRLNKLQQEKDRIYHSAEIEAVKKDIMQKEERQLILTQIARGQIPLKKAMVVDKVIEYIDVVPDYGDRKNAIAELNKMDGSYAPAKQEITGKDGKPLIPTNAEDIMDKLQEIPTDELIQYLDKRAAT